MKTSKASLRTIVWPIIVAGLLIGMIQLLSFIPAKERSPLVINEFMAANLTDLTDEDGIVSDWIELYNQSGQTINLADFALTDDPLQPEKWIFPKMNLHGGEYLIVFASGKNQKSTSPGSLLHTNFKLSQQGGYLAVYNRVENELVSFSGHSIPMRPKFSAFSQLPAYPLQFVDISYGRQADGLGYFESPSPGQPNVIDGTQTRQGIVSDVEFSVERGFYDEPFALELSTTTLDAIIYYTTDGSEPNEKNGMRYSKPIAIDKTSIVRVAAFAQDVNFLPSYVDTHSYIFLDDILTQPANPPGFPMQWGHHSRDIPQKHKEGEPVIADYEMDPYIVNHPDYKGLIKDGLKSIPSVSIVGNFENFFIYANPRERGFNWERPTSVEFINPNNKADRFQVYAGLRIQGNRGRYEDVLKHSFRLIFRRRWGPAKLKYPVFPDSPVKEFENLVLRAGYNESYVNYNKALIYKTYSRDQWSRATQIAMSGIGAHGRYVHLYINGLYWGLYDLVERPDAAFTSAYLGGREEDWYATKHGPIPISPVSNIRLESEAISGSSARFEMLHELAKQGHLDDPEKYAVIKQYINTSQVIDYIILNWYTGNQDWRFSNWYAGIRNPDGQARYFVWDAELTWAAGPIITMDKNDGRSNGIKTLFEALIQNPDFQIELADRLYKHLFNDGALTEANTMARWLKINQQIELAIIAESARWGDLRSDPPFTQADWVTARDKTSTRMEGTVATLLTLVREAGYYPAIDPPVFNQHGGLIKPGFSLTMTAPTGLIYYTADGSDPRLPVTGDANPKARVYHKPLMFNEDTHIKARLLEGEVWSALREATFKVGEGGRNLRITEIMYNPPGGDKYEFVKIRNTDNIPLDLAWLSFEGINFTFPSDALPLQPNEIVTLVRDPVAFAERYPGVPIGGVYRGKLANEGEKISIFDVDEVEVVSVTYDDDENGWPVSPDGRGNSLVLIHPQSDLDNPKSWQASTNVLGSPGIPEPGSEIILKP